MNALYSVVIVILWFSILNPSFAQNKNIDYLEIRENVEKAFGAGDPKEIIKSSLALIEAIPNDPEAWYALSVGYELNEEFTKAVEAAERVQKLGYTTRAYLPYRISKLAMNAGNQEKALFWVEQALNQKYEERQKFANDPIYAPLHHNPKFQKLAGILPTGLSRVDALAFDLNYLVEEAQRLHAGQNREAFSIQIFYLFNPVVVFFNKQKLGT